MNEPCWFTKKTMDVRKYNGARVIIGFSESMAAIGRLAVEDERVYLDDAQFVPATGSANIMKDHAFVRAYRTGYDGEEEAEDSVYRLGRPELNPNQIAFIVQIIEDEGKSGQNNQNAK